MTVAGPDDRRSGGAKPREVADGIGDVLCGDVAEDAAEKDEIGRDSARVGIGHQGVRGDHFDSLKARSLCGTRGELRIVRVELDQTRRDIRLPGVPGERRDEIVALPRAHADRPHPAGTGGVQRGADQPLNYQQAPAQRGARVLVVLVPCSPVHDDRGGYGRMRSHRASSQGTTHPAGMAERRYDLIGAGYATTRREDPRIAARIHAALDQAHTVVNVGAGAGSYEPRERRVIAVEPSEVMAAQRPPELPRAILAEAYPLPLADRSVDGAMALLTVHHWDGQQERGVRELRRVRGPVVILTYDPRVSARMWLMADYLREVAELDRRIFPLPEQLARWLGTGTRIETVPVARDTPDWTLGSFWAHPERVLDPQARAGTSGFARMPAEVVARVVEGVRRDLEDGTWEERHGHLRGLAEYDAGLRLLTHSPA